MTELIVTDPLALGRRAGRYGLREARKAIRESQEAAFRLLEDAYAKALHEAERRLQEEYRVTIERINATLGQIDIETKSRMADLRREYIAKIMEKIKEKIDIERNSDWYREFMERVFERLSVEAEKLGGLIVRVSEKDLPLARQLVARYGDLLKLSDKPANIAGGAVAYAPSTGTHVDYSVESIISSHFTRLQVEIMRVLESS